MNFVLFTGNLVDGVQLRQSQDQNQRPYAFGKVAVHQGKNAQTGEQKPAMFFDFVVYGYDAQNLAQAGHKGDLIALCGRLEENTSIGQNGQTYVNRRVVCNSLKLCQKVMTQQATSVPQQQTYVPQQATSVPQQQTYVPQQATSVPQQPTNDIWGSVY